MFHAIETDTVPSENKVYLTKRSVSVLGYPKFCRYLFTPLRHVCFFTV